MKKFTILLLSIFVSSFVMAQDVTVQEKINSISLIKSFIIDLADQEKPTDVVLSRYILVNNPSDELYDYLEVSLEEIRINLMTKKLDDIQYIPYHKMPSKEVRDIDPEDLDTNGMYFLNYRKRQMLAVYVENGKIGSFTLVSKGNNKAHFILY